MRATKTKRLQLAHSGQPSYPFGDAGKESKSAMSKPITVSIPHRLGKDEARRRLEAGLASARTHFGSVLRVEEDVWSGDALAFKASAVGQQTSGTITVAE